MLFVERPRKRQVQAKARPEWLRAYNFAADGYDVAGRGKSFTSGTLKSVIGSAGQALHVNALDQGTTGEIVSGISTGITFVIVAEKLGNIAGGTITNFIIGETETGTGGYNYGFYENTNTTNLNFFVHNGSAAAATGGPGWDVGSGPAVWTATYGDGDNNIRLYRNGLQVGSAAQTGSIRRLSTALLRAAFWASGTPNFLFYAAAISNRCMPAAEVARKFRSVDAAYDSIFLPSVLPFPLSASGGPTYTLAADAGAYTLTGNAAALTAQRKVAADAGSFSLTGNAAALSAQRKLSAGAGSYTLTGNAVALFLQHNLVPLAASYALTGNDATLTYTPATGAYTLTADAGSYALTGNAAGLSFQHSLVPLAGAYTLTGSEATLTYTQRVLTAEAGAFSLTGNNATLTYSGFVADRRHAGGFKRIQGPRKGYIIKDKRYWLTEDELMAMVAQELADISKRDIKQVTAGKPKPVSKKVWDLIKPMGRLEALTQPDQYDEDDDLEVLMLFL